MDKAARDWDDVALAVLPHFFAAPDVMEIQ
jgi:hypothetical protein